MVGTTMGPALLVSGAVALVFVLASALYYLHFDRLGGDVERPVARRALRDGVSLGLVLVGVGVFGAAVDATATVAGFEGVGPPPGPAERALLALPTGWLPWLVAVGFLLVVASGAVATAEQVRGRYLD